MTIAIAFVVGCVIGGGLVWAFRGWIARTKEKIASRLKITI